MIIGTASWDALWAAARPTERLKLRHEDGWRTAQELSRMWQYSRGQAHKIAKEKTLAGEFEEATAPYGPRQTPTQFFRPKIKTLSGERG